LMMRRVPGRGIHIGSSWQPRHIKLHAGANARSAGSSTNAGFITWERQSKLDNFGEAACHQLPPPFNQDEDTGVAGYASGAIELVSMVSYVQLFEDYKPKRPWCFVVRGRLIDTGKPNQSANKTKVEGKIVDLYLQATSRDEMQVWIRAIHSKIIQEMLKVQSAMTVQQLRQHTTGVLNSRRPRSGSRVISASETARTVLTRMGSSFSKRKLKRVPSGNKKANTADPAYATANQWQAQKKAGNSAYRQQQYREAIDNYLAALEQCRSDNVEDVAKLHGNIAAAYLMMAKYREVVSHCEESLKLLPHFQKCRVRMGRAKMCIGSLNEAQQLFQQVVDENLANGQSKDGVDEAQAGIEVLQQARAKIAECEEILSKWSRQMQQQAPAATLISTAKQGLDAALEVIKVIPAATRTRMLLAEGLLAAGAAGLGHGLPQHSRGSVNELAVRQLDGKGGYLQQAELLATQLLKEQDQASAETTLNQHVSRNSLLQLRARALLCMGRYPLCATTIRMALRSDPDNTQYISLHKQCKRLQEVIQNAETLVKADMDTLGTDNTQTVNGPAALLAVVNTDTMAPCTVSQLHLRAAFCFLQIALKADLHHTVKRKQHFLSGSIENATAATKLDPYNAVARVLYATASHNLSLVSGTSSSHTDIKQLQAACQAYENALILLQNNNNSDCDNGGLKNDTTMRSYDVHDVKVKLNTTLATLKDRLGIQQGASEEEIAAAWKQQMITSVSVEDISSLGIKELKRRLQEAGIKHDDCLTKKDLVGRLQENAPEQAATAERSGMMNAKTHSKGKKKDRTAASGKPQLHGRKRV
jgi:tetratricopeptide (TPR) repeat protein